MNSRNTILSSLPESALASLTPQLELVSYKTGEKIIEAGQLIEFHYFPETLVVSQQCYLKDGSTAATSMVGHDGLLGVNALLTVPRARFWATATVGGTARRIRVEDLRAEYDGNVQLRKLILGYLSDRLFQLGQQSVCSTRHDLRERLSTWLLMILDRAVSTTLPLTHQAIAAHLGARRAGVTIHCNTLRSRGIIDMKRAKLTIIDRNALEALACECYQQVGLQAAERLAPR